jgi:hypothetical protein
MMTPLRRVPDEGGWFLSSGFVQVLVAVASLLGVVWFAGMRYQSDQAVIDRRIMADSLRHDRTVESVTRIEAAIQRMENRQQQFYCATQPSYCR